MLGRLESFLLAPRRPSFEMSLRSSSFSFCILFRSCSSFSGSLMFAEAGCPKNDREFCPLPDRVDILVRSGFFTSVYFSFLID